MQVDLILSHATIIPMDPQRQILYDAAIAVQKNRIHDIGATSAIEEKYTANKTINCQQKIVLPGLIDAHGHGGHSLLKGILYERPSGWMPHITHAYHHCTTDRFWLADGQLSALERLKSGVTTGVSVMGSVPRSDTAIPGGNHAQGYTNVGVREIVCVGLANPPWPHDFSRFDGNRWVRNKVSYADALAGMEEVIRTWNHAANDRIRAYCAPFVLITSVNPSAPTTPELANIATEHDRYQWQKVREIANKYQTRIHTDAFGSMIQMCKDEPDALLGPDVHLQHCRGISFLEAQILAETKTNVSSSPGPGQAKARCPVPELLGLGVKVAISTDGTAPGVSFDMFQAARKTQLIHQFMSHDGYNLPVGKLLEMITIDAAAVVGWDDELGSLEIGKKADIIIVNNQEPHMQPPYLPVHRLILNAVSKDVETVIVDGEIVMENRQVLKINEQDVYQLAEEEAAITIEQAGLDDFLYNEALIWRNSRLVF